MAGVCLDHKNKCGVVDSWHSSTPRPPQSPSLTINTLIQFQDEKIKEVMQSAYILNRLIKKADPHH